MTAQDLEIHKLFYEFRKKLRLKGNIIRFLKTAGSSLKDSG